MTTPYRLAPTRNFPKGYTVVVEPSDYRRREAFILGHYKSKWKAKWDAWWYSLHHEYSIIYTIPYLGYLDQSNHGLIFRPNQEQSVVLRRMPL